MSLLSRHDHAGKIILQGYFKVGIALVIPKQYIIMRLVGFDQIAL